jgi:hypothetical protein
MKKGNITSEAASALAKARHAATPKRERIAHSKAMAAAHWSSPAGIARRRAIIEKKIGALQAKLAELDALEKRIAKA